MAKTNYRNCWWLIQVLDGKYDSGSYRNGTGYSMRNINDLRPIGARIDWIVSHERDMDVDEDILKNKEKFRQMLMRWRTIIYNEFGLAILQESTSGSDNHGGGGYYYYLANPELLDEDGKTLRDHIKFLAESEKDRENWVTLTDMTTRFTGGTSSMGFISAGGPSSFGYLSKESTSYRAVLGEENLEIIQFAMQFGEVLTIKYGKMRNGVDINAPYTLEPYQLKEIEGRWYVIGNLYPLGHKELAEIAVYDLTRLEFSDEDNPDVLYEPVKGFEIADTFGIDPVDLRKLTRVIAVKLTAHTKEIAEYFTRFPLCSAQVDEENGKFKLYIRFTTDLIVQLGAYGAEISFDVVGGRVMKPTINTLLNFFRKDCE